MTERARAERLPSCAGIACRIDAAGKARMVTEYPLGSGFGAAAPQAVEASHYPPAAGPRLFFKVHTLIVR